MGAKSMIVDCMGNCFVCGNPKTEVHHVFYGTANRKQSDIYGMVLPLCPEHHRGNTGIHNNRDFDTAMKEMAQRKFEERIGSRELFTGIFGKSWL